MFLSDEQQPTCQMTDAHARHLLKMADASLPWAIMAILAVGIAVFVTGAIICCGLCAHLHRRNTVAPVDDCHNSTHTVGCADTEQTQQQLPPADVQARQPASLQLMDHATLEQQPQLGHEGQQLLHSQQSQQEVLEQLQQTEQHNHQLQAQPQQQLQQQLAVLPPLPAGPIPPSALAPAALAPVGVRRGLLPPLATPDAATPSAGAIAGAPPSACAMPPPAAGSVCAPAANPVKHCAASAGQLNGRAARAASFKCWANADQSPGNSSQASHSLVAADAPQQSNSISASLSDWATHPQDQIAVCQQQQRISQQLQFQQLGPQQQQERASFTGWPGAVELQSKQTNILGRLADVLQQEHCTLSALLQEQQRQQQQQTGQRASAASGTFLALLPVVLQQLVPVSSRCLASHAEALLLLLMPGAAAPAGSDPLSSTTAASGPVVAAGSAADVVVASQLDQAFQTALQLHDAAAACQDPTEVLLRLQEYITDNQGIIEEVSSHLTCRPPGMHALLHRHMW